VPEATQQAVEQRPPGGLDVADEWLGHLCGMRIGSGHSPHCYFFSVGFWIETAAESERRGTGSCRHCLERAAQ
jgi:hypothetical protein